jgi:hypothetical protein
VALIEPDLGDDVPEHIKELIEEWNFYVPDEMSEEEAEVYARAAMGCCMTCGAELGALTMAVANRAGIVLLYCGGPCYQDMQVVHWLKEQHDDHIQRIMFRGGQSGDQADEGNQS